MVSAGVDTAMMDVIGAAATSRDVYHLDRSVDDFELSHIEVRHVDRNDEKAVHEAVRLSMSGFYPDETDVPESAMNVGLRSAAHDITDGFIAIADGMPVGAAFCSSSHGITLLYGASTRPEFRTQGVQRALIGARLACGKARGSHHAVVVSRPGHATERSVSKLGFQLAYVRMALMKRAAH